MIVRGLETRYGSVSFGFGQKAFEPHDDGIDHTP
jgi:hypothetical protein